MSARLDRKAIFLLRTLVRSASFSAVGAIPERQKDPSLSIE
jgi:hypothetical protein